ncbi:GrpE protein [Fibrella aestuarina BUZ 2]|uniref:Protein GrpE n=1 Tax=Fibrella aestuarina BUZ 2 TaxID=1166018 RepID=I0KAF1_9BACT|nr:nucleotide exchange factor GrpE [Fibrella aestuarina]CCH01104.1 GrpE protein [Fibrella aestuarina BUZ 2]
MENKDIVDESSTAPDNSTENLTTEEAETINGGTPDDLIDLAAAAPAAEAAPVGSELAELKDKYLRLYADFENFRRRTAKEKLDLIANANEGLLVSLLPVVDDFERAMQSIGTSADPAAALEGIKLIHNKFVKTLEGKGLKPMTSKGEPFNADLHESVTQFPAPSDDLKGKVIDEVERGYLLNDKVIRYAKVIVGA